MPERTIFEKIMAQELAADVVYEDEDIFAFRDINPQAPTHILVIPKQKCTGFAELATLGDQFIGTYMKKIAQVAQAAGLAPEGYRIVFNQGKNANQTVPYIHAHILGGRPMSWPPG